MLYAFGFETIGVLVSDLYFVDPNPGKDMEGPEQGVRLELRALDRTKLRGSVYSAQPIEVGRPIWRVDLLESVEHPGTLDRAHHHPRFREWEPGARRFVDELTADPLAWLAKRLGEPESVLADAGVDPEAVAEADLEGMRQAVPEIVAAAERLLVAVRGGKLGHPTDDQLTNARIGWL